MAFLPVSDPRVNGWPMLHSPFPTLFICLFYAYFAKNLGPRLMENRKPFQLKNILIVYNAIQTVFSAWIFYEVSTRRYYRLAEPSRLRLLLYKPSKPRANLSVV